MSGNAMTPQRVTKVRLYTEGLITYLICHLIIISNYKRSVSLVGSTHNTRRRPTPLSDPYSLVTTNKYDTTRAAVIIHSPPYRFSVPNNINTGVYIVSV